MLGFNFGSNHKCVRRDNISKIESELTIGSIHRSFDLKMKNREPNKVGLDWFSSVLIRTRQDRIPFRFRLSISSVLSEPLTSLR